MLPGATVPRSLAGLLAVFRPCFTAPTFPTFVGLVVGLIAQTRRRTVCGMLTGAGLDQVWHHSRAHRLFTNARWSGDALGLVLADLIVARLLPADSALTIAVDDTLFKRSGKKVFGVAWHHDGAAKGPKPIGFGNCWVVAGIVVQLPFLSRPVCLPVLARLWRVGFQNSATAADQRFQAAGSYWLIKPPRIGRRRILPWTGSGTGASGRGGRSCSARCGRCPL